MLIINKCCYDTMWSGCQRLATDNGRCKEHAALVCVKCGAPAVRECSEDHDPLCGACTHDSLAKGRRCDKCGKPAVSRCDFNYHKCAQAHCSTCTHDSLTIACTFWIGAERCWAHADNGRCAEHAAARCGYCNRPADEACSQCGAMHCGVCARGHRHKLAAVA